jgi:hypothetical protein
MEFVIFMAFAVMLIAFMKPEKTCGFCDAYRINCIGKCDNANKPMVWSWDLFGNETVVTRFSPSKIQPSLRVRILSRIIMGSKWKKVEWEEEG